MKLYYLTGYPQIHNTASYPIHLCGARGQRQGWKNSKYKEERETGKEGRRDTLKL